MSEFLFQYYPVHPTTWVYLSSLLMIGVYFKFGRFWSVRNLDIALLILLAPGLLLVHFGQQRAWQEVSSDELDTELVDSTVMTEASPTSLSVPQFGPPGDTSQGAVGELAVEEVAAFEEDLLTATDGDSRSEQPRELSGKAVMLVGYIWLWSVLGVLLARLLLDPTMVRRPLLEPNLSTGGLAFIGCSMFVFLMANVIQSPTTDADLAGAKGAEQLLAGVVDADMTKDLHRHGPGNALLHSIPSLVTTPLYWQEAVPTNARYIRTAKTMAIISHLAVVLGIVAIGYRHFGSMKMGIGVATLYLMLPYTAMMTGSVIHILPAALLIWGVLCYRRPIVAGSFIGLAIGVAYYPIFLLPLWISFYWQRGLMRFTSGVAIMLCVSVLSLIFVSSDYADFVNNVQRMFGIWLPRTERLLGVWGLGWDPVYRFPILAAFVVISFSFALWPAQKNLGTLLSCSGAVMVATQFWHGDGGGTYMAWFLPLTLLTIFRPNLEDRVALSVLGDGLFPRRRPQLRRIDRAA